MALYQGHTSEIIKFVAIGSKKLKQLEIGWDYYNDGSTKHGRNSRNRWNHSRIYKKTKQKRGIYHGASNNKWVA